MLVPYRRFLSIGTRSFILSIIMSALTVAFSFTNLVAFRFLIAIVLLFFLPGFNLLEILHKHTAFLSRLQRLMISIGLSIGIVIVTNYVMTFLGVLIDLDNLTLVLVSEVLIFSIFAFFMNQKIGKM